MSGRQPTRDQKNQKPRRRRSLRTWFMLLLLLTIPPAAVQLNDHRASFIATLDHQYLRFQRAWRRAYVKVSPTLPGTPSIKTLDTRLRAAGFKSGDPLLIRIFKHEFEFEIWMRDGASFKLFETYPICRYSGHLGPKLKEGDRQSPEGFYTVAKGQLNPNSRWHRSFNLGFPNLFDRSYGRTGSFLMVHGGCSSIGCYAMTNDAMDEIWQLVTKALQNGQRRIQVQSFPFRMTEANLAARRDHKWAAYWADLKVGHDLFEDTRQPLQVSVCDGQYMFAKAEKRASPPRLKRNCPRPKSVATR
ncbi:MAG: murein L,D-transpeptidase family protein [Pseudomonadota bacterium]